MPSSTTHVAARLLLVHTAAGHNGKVDVMKAIFRLAAHFNAVAARYATDAERHKAIGTVYVATAAAITGDEHRPAQ